MNRMQEVVGKVGEMWSDQDDKTDAIKLLKNDHRKVETLFSEWEKLRTSAKKRALLHQIIQELTIHATVEEDLVYPILEGSDKKKTEERTREAEEEHHLLKIALVELSSAGLDADTLKAKVTVVRELVRHHVKEEEKELLPALKRSGEDMEELGSRIMRRKQQLMKAGMSKPATVKRTTAAKTRSTTTKKRTTAATKRASASRRKSA